MKLKEVFYSIHNGGDGSAFIQWMESKKLAEWDQEHLSVDLGWGEPCLGSLEFEDFITIKNDIITNEKYLLNLVELRRYNMSDEKHISDFIAEFFPNGEIPYFTVYDSNTDSKKYRVEINGTIIQEQFRGDILNQKLEEIFNRETE